MDALDLENCDRRGGRGRTCRPARAQMIGAARRSWEGLQDPYSLASDYLRLAYYLGPSDSSLVRSARIVPGNSRSALRDSGLRGGMPESTRPKLHPLLFERSYWRNRLDALKLSLPSLLLKERPELSSGAVRVDEFRLRMHDGVRLYGLRAQSTIQAEPRAAVVRIVGASDLPRVDRQAIERGEIEFVLQERPGRKLEDRVLDVVSVCRMAAKAADGRQRPVRLVEDGRGTPRDEFLIASQLLASDIAPALPDRKSVV